MEIFTIRHGAWRAEICPARGANCISLRHVPTGARLLREPRYTPGEHPFLFGMPLLFPVNRISGGRFHFEGREYRFPVNEPNTGCHLHGGLHDRPFAVISQSEDALSCVCRVEATEDFPHAFEITVSYRLDEQGLTQTVRLVNCSAQAMPCLLGFHTTFAIPFIPGGEVRVAAQIGEEYERDGRYLPTGIRLTADEVTGQLLSGTFDPLSRPISRHCRAVGEGRMTLTDLRHGVRVVYENDEKYAFRLIYNGEADGFICLEPQNCLVDAPNNVFGRTYSGFDAIAPGDMREYRSRIYMESV